MTRAQFEARFAASQSNTSGYTDEQLDEINDEVFAAVKNVDADDYDARQLVSWAFDKAHRSR